MKKIGILLAGAIAFLAIAACSDDEDNVNKGNWDEDSYWASQATVTSSDANFTANDNGGEIHFKTEGGQVTLAVDCGCGWVADNAATDLFTATATGTTLTVTAVQNTVEKDLEGTITLKTETRKVPFATITVTQAAYGAPTISVETNEWSVPAVGELTTHIAVEASEEWVVEVSPPWLTIVQTSDGISLTADENEGTEERSEKIILSCTDGIRTTSEYINVIQDGKAYISFGKEYLSIGYGAGSASITVDSNFNWDYSYDTSNGWFTISRNGDTLVATATENDTDNEREGTVTLTAGDGAENVVEAELTVKQAMLNEEDLVLTYTLTSANTVVRLPLSGTVNCTVNWGDGEEQKVTSSQPSHTYALAGEYNVTVNGTVTAISHNGISSSTNYLTTLTAVKQWGATGLTSMERAFYYCEGLKSLPEKTGNAFAKVTSFNRAFIRCGFEELPANLFGDSEVPATDFEYVFENCKSLKAIPDGLLDKCTAAQKFYQAFYGCNYIEAIPNGLFDNCTEATDLSDVFCNCNSIKKIPEGLFDKCTKVTTLEGAFYGCKSITEIPKGLFDNCTEVKSFYTTFGYCSNLAVIPEGLFDKCPNVTSFQAVFTDCPAITKIPKGLFDYCTKVTSFRTAFYDCSGITEIPEGLFNNCPNVTNFGYVFSFCTNIQGIPEGLFDSCTKATNFKAAFQRCAYVEEIPKGLFDNCTGVTDFSYCFLGLKSITKIPEGLFDNCTEVTDFECVFQTCNNIKDCPVELFDHNMKVENFLASLNALSSVVGESPYTEIEVNGEKVKVHLYERENYTSELGCVKPPYFNNCFKNSTFSDIDSIPYYWGGNEESTSSVSENSIPCAETSVVIEPESN